MARFVTSMLVAAGALALAACSDPPTAVDTALGPVLVVDSLQSEDAHQLPCCAKDSAGVHVTILGGTLTLRRLPFYTDTVFTPDGPMSRACVHGVPNGSTIYQNGLVVLTDSSTFLLQACDTGTFSLALSERLDYTNGSSRTLDAVLASGPYGARPDTLTLLDGRLGAGQATTISRDTIAVTAGGHVLRFIAGPVL